MTFELDRKRMIGVMVCWLFLCALAFLGGLVTGIGLWAPSRAEAGLVPGSRQTAQTVGRPALPSLPAVTPPVQRPSPLGEKNAPTASPAANDARPSPPEAPPPAPVAAEDPKADLFSVQFGCFPDAKDAKQLQADLKERGYATKVITSTDADQREWHLVRQPGYNTLTSATQAASAFRNKEHLPVLVRPSNSL